MSLQLLKITNEDLKNFKLDMQEAFQIGAIEGGYDMPNDCVILPFEDIDNSLNIKNSIAYKAVLDGKMVGGAIIVLNNKKRSGNLHFLYVKHGYQNKGIGKFIWFEIEKLHKEIYHWETCTPYFEKRNIHFYLNVCKFKITRYDSHDNEEYKSPYDVCEKDNDESGMFEFEKDIEYHKTIKHSNKNISTDRLILRTFAISDLDPYYKLISNPRVNCYKDMVFDTIEEAKEDLEEKIKTSDATEFVVSLKDTNEFIGFLFGMYEGDTFSACWNFLEEYEGCGYAYEATKAYFEYLFNELNVRRIYAYTEDNNHRSQKLCEKLGMRKEGEFKEFISFINNPDGTPRYENTLQYAILKKEWNNKFKM